MIIPVTPPPRPLDKRKTPTNRTLASKPVQFPFRYNQNVSVLVVWHGRMGGGGRGPDPLLAHDVGLLTLGPKLEPLLDHLVLLVDLR